MATVNGEPWLEGGVGKIWSLLVSDLFGFAVLKWHFVLMESAGVTIIKVDNTVQEDCNSLGSWGASFLPTPA